MFPGPSRRLLVTLGIVVAGCAGAPSGGAAGRGACTLGLAYADPVAGEVPLAPPYVVPMGTRTASGVRTSRVEYIATGWNVASITVRNPHGTIVSTGIRWFDPSSFGQGFDVPGLWTVRWTDEVAGCDQELSVLVLP